MDYIAQTKLVEGGKKYMPGDKVSVKGDRLVFLLSKEFVLPKGGWEKMPDDIYLAVMEARD